MSIDKPNKNVVWQAIYSTLMGAGIIPLAVRLHPDDISVDIQLQDNAFDDTELALHAFGLPEGEVWSMDNDGPYLWSKGKPDEFYAWGQYCNSYVKSSLLPGWNVSIYTQGRTADYPLPTTEPEPESQADAATLVAEAVAVLDAPTCNGNCIADDSGAVVIADLCCPLHGVKAVES